VHTLPLEVFVVVGSFIEEVIPPIPSPSIVVLAGSFAAVQAYSIQGIALLVLLASVGKTLGAFVVYTVTKHAQERLLEMFGHHVGITPDDVTRFSKRFTGGFRDYVSLAILRSTPIIPSILLSFGSGVIKLPIRVFLVGTFVGTIVRDSFYIFVGYSGTGVLKTFTEKTSHIESLITFGVLFACGILLVYFLVRRFKKRTSP
jgi:membrane protein DedA with SNARE-associated domain